LHLKMLKMGLGLLCKMMAGDTFSFWRAAGIAAHPVSCFTAASADTVKRARIGWLVPNVKLWKRSELP